MPAGTSRSPIPCTGDRLRVAHNLSPLRDRLSRLRRDLRWCGTVDVTQSDGAILRAALANRGRLHSGMMATIGVDLSKRAGADASNRPLLYNPNPFVSGSSISHWDTSAFPNQLMEPAINGDLTHEVTPPQDLSFKLLQDTGW